MTMKLDEIAARLGEKVSGDGGVEIRGVAKIEEAGEGEAGKEG